jgi:hypothetical protein
MNQPILISMQDALRNAPPYIAPIVWPLQIVKPKPIDDTPARIKACKVTVSILQNDLNNMLHKYKNKCLSKRSVHGRKFRELQEQLITADTKLLNLRNGMLHLV